ncbi:MAG: 30S ribosomal protein S21 [Fidelibacterota bacterium]
MVEVNVRDGEMLERALRRFKKKWERAGVLRDIKKRAFYTKPSDLKRDQEKKTRRRLARLRPR